MLMNEIWLPLITVLSICLALTGSVSAETIIEVFDSPTIAEHWTIGPGTFQRRDDKWSLVSNPGFLTILTQNSDIHQKNNNPRNFFLRDVPYENYQITTYLEFSPRQDFEQAGLIIWDGLDDYLRLTSIWAGEQRFEAAIEANAIFSSQLQPNPAGDSVYLRIRKVNRTYTFLYSSDGEQWEQIGSSVYATLQNPRVGLFAISPGSGRELEARFQFFAIEELDPEDFRIQASLPADSVPIEPAAAQVKVPYINPVFPYDAPDPTIIKHEDYFYAITTNGFHHGQWQRLPILRSPDLVSWELVGMVFPDELPAWVHQSEPHLWAPDLVYHDGKFFVYYSAVARGGRAGDGPHGIGVAWADHPAGPYQSDDEPLVVGPGFRNIDPMVFTDDDGKRYMYWGSASQPLLVQELSYDGRSLIGEPKPVLLPQGGPVIVDADLPPQPPHEGLVEGPWVIKRSDYYYMFYSGDSFYPDRYAVMVARATSPWGPFEKYPHNPIMRHNEKFTAPGHNAIIQDDAGQDWMVYHAYDRDNMDLHRVMLIDKIEWRDGWPTVRDFQGPSFTWQTDGPIINKDYHDQLLSLNKPVEASSEESSEFSADKAVDGNLLTKWRAHDASMPQWLLLDLGAVHDVTRTEVVFESALHFYQYILEYSTDGDTWETYAERTDFFNDRVPYYAYIDQNQVKARYFRLTVTAAQPGFPPRKASVVDFRVFGRLQ